MSMLYLRPEVVPEYEIGNDISVYTCHVERSRDISKQIPPLTSFGRNDN